MLHHKEHTFCVYILDFIPFFRTYFFYSNHKVLMSNPCIIINRS